MAQNETNSILDANMIIAAECLANPAFMGTKEDIANAANVSRSTLYRWLRNEDFINIVNDLIDKYIAAEAGLVWKSLIRECSKGNMQAIRLYFELKDKYKEQGETATEPTIIHLVRE